MKKATKKNKSARKKATPGKKLATKNAAREKAEIKTQAVGRKRETASARKKQARGKHRGAESVRWSPEGPGPRSSELPGDLQGLSNVEDADSESVAELVEEGNAFEANLVKGVEDASNADTGPVRTHEVPEDDVPEEYYGNKENE